MRNIILTCALSIGLIGAAQSQGLKVKESEPITDIDGNTYKTIQIGNQVWMAENLKTKHYRDGSSVDFYVYDNKDENENKYGLLYSSKAVAKSQLAPEGWHIPTKEEWEELAKYLGGLEMAGEKLSSDELVLMLYLVGCMIFLTYSNGVGKQLVSHHHP